MQDDLHILRAAQAEAYELFGALLAWGLTARARARALDLPELAEPLRDAGLSDDELAAAHQALFGQAVPPLVSVFLEPDGSAGGAVTEAVQVDLQGCGVRPPQDLPADHLAVLLFALARLTGAEADALEDGVAPAAREAAALQVRLLDRHVLPILPPLAHAVATTDAPFYPEVFARATELLVHHRGTLSGLPSLDPGPEPPTLSRALEDPATGLKDVAALLARPARAGAFLGRADLARIGRRQDVPRGFGRREDELRGLLFGAIDHDRFGEVAAHLGDHFEAAACAYEAWAAPLPPAVARFAGPWIIRARATVAGLRRLAAAPRVSLDLDPG